MSDNEMLSPADITDAGRKKIKLSSGKHVVIGRLSVALFVDVMGNMPDVAALKRLREKSERQDVMQSGKMTAMMRCIERVVTAGVIIPKLYEDPVNGPTARDFHQNDQQLIFREVIELTGASEKAGAEVIPLSKTSG